MANIAGCLPGLVYDTVNKICSDPATAKGICGTTSGFRNTIYF